LIKKNKELEFNQFSCPTLQKSGLFG